MTVSSVNLTNLRNAKNAVIGNPSAKLQLSRDASFVSNLVDCLNYDGAPPEIRIEAAHVIASLSYGSDEALLALLRANAPRALLYSISQFTQAASPALRAAFARALRAIAVSAADAVGPSLWGLGPASSIAEEDASEALEFLFTPEALDTLLPLLSQSHLPICISIAQLLASSMRARHYRTPVAEWLPPSEKSKAREKEKERPKRGWEKAALGPGPARMGGWTAGVLVGLLAGANVKLQEAALGALAALAKDNPDVASALSRPSNDLQSPSPLTTVLNLAKSRSADVQITASLCATNILRALPHHQQDESATRAVMNTVNRMIASPLDRFPEDADSLISNIGAGWGGAGGNLGHVSLTQRTKACFVLYHLVLDDAPLCQAAFDRGCLAQLVGLVTALPLPPVPPQTPGETELMALVQGGGPGIGAGDTGAGPGAGSGRVYVPSPEEGAASEMVPEDWCEPEGRATLREAALTAIAAISLFDNDVRRSLTEPSMYPSYHHPSPSLPLSHPLVPSLPDPTPHTPSSFSPSPSPPVPPPPQGTPPLFPVLLAALSHPAPGVRYAACQCIRAMSRAVAVLRTNIVDSGLGVGVWRRCVRGSKPLKQSAVDGRETPTNASPGGGGTEGEGESEPEKDKRVLNAGLAVICNLVNDFSPLRGVLLEDGLVERLVEILGTHEEAGLRISALWAMKNLLCRSGLDVKGRVMRGVGWGRVVGLLDDPELGVREQALNVLRNLTENEAGIELVYREVGEGVVLDHVASALKSPNDDIVLQAAFLLANLSNDIEAGHQTRILAHPKILPALHAALVAATASSSSSLSPSASFSPTSPTSSPVTSITHPPTSLHPYTSRAQARNPLVTCVAQLAMTGAAQIRAAGFEDALRHLCEWASGGLGGGGGRGRGAVGVGVGGWDEERGVVERARRALRLIERG